MSTSEGRSSGHRPQEVLREFPPIGKYRIRLLRDPSRPDAHPGLDIREYVHSDSFEGFTRRGILLVQRSEIDLLRDILGEILERR